MGTVIELAVRAPVRFSPGQTRLVLIVAGALVVALLVGGLVEVVFGGVAGTILRLTGHAPPRKSTFEMSLDDLDARLNRKEK